MKTYSLPEVANFQLLELLRILLPRNNNLPKNLTKLKKILDLDKFEINTHFFCEICNVPLKETKICENS